MNGAPVQVQIRSQCWSCGTPAERVRAMRVGRVYHLTFTCLMCECAWSEKWTSAGRIPVVL